MSWRQDLSNYQSDTLLIVEIAEQFLQDYWDHDATTAENTLDEYFTIKKKWIDEGYVRDQHSWRIATEAQYRICVGGAPGELPEWRRTQGLNKTPPEALEYLRRHYWQRHG